MILRTTVFLAMAMTVILTLPQQEKLVSHQAAAAPTPEEQLCEIDKHLRIIEDRHPNHQPDTFPEPSYSTWRLYQQARVHFLERYPHLK